MPYITQMSESVDPDIKDTLPLPAPNTSSEFSVAATVSACLYVTFHYLVDNADTSVHVILIKR